MIVVGFCQRKLCSFQVSWAFLTVRCRHLSLCPSFVCDYSLTCLFCRLLSWQGVLLSRALKHAAVGFGILALISVLVSEEVYLEIGYSCRGLYGNQFAFPYYNSILSIATGLLDTVVLELYPYACCLGIYGFAVRAHLRTHKMSAHSILCSGECRIQWSDRSLFVSYMR